MKNHMIRIFASIILFSSGITAFSSGGLVGIGI